LFSGITHARPWTGHQQAEIRVDRYLPAYKRREEIVAGGEVGGQTETGRPGPEHWTAAEQVSDIVGDVGYVGDGWRRRRVVVLDHRAPDQAIAGETRAAGNGRQAGRTRTEAGDRNQGHGEHAARAERFQQLLQSQPVIRKPGE